MLELLGWGLIAYAVGYFVRFQDKKFKKEEEEKRKKKWQEENLKLNERRANRSSYDLNEK